jgi:hypothetical protein
MWAGLSDAETARGRRLVLNIQGCPVSGECKPQAQKRPKTKITKVTHVFAAAPKKTDSFWAFRNKGSSKTRLNKSRTTFRSCQKK